MYDEQITRTPVRKAVFIKKSNIINKAITSFAVMSRRVFDRFYTVPTTQLLIFTIISSAKPRNNSGE